MFGQIKNYSILILVIIILSLGSYSLYQTNRAKKFKEQAEDREAIMKVKEKDWITKSGKLVHENSVIKLQSDKVAKEVFKKDSLLIDLGIKWKNVHSVSKTTIENHYHITSPITNNGDSTYKIKEWKNTWLTLNGDIDIKKNTIDINYTHKDTLSQVIHYKRSKKFLGLIPYGKFEFLSETTTSDSLSKVVDQTTYIKQK